MLLNGVALAPPKTDCHSKNTTKLDQGLKAPFKKDGFLNTASQRKLLYRIESGNCWELDQKVTKNQGL